MDLIQEKVAAIHDRLREAGVLAGPLPVLSKRDATSIQTVVEDLYNVKIMTELTSHIGNNILAFIRREFNDCYISISNHEEITRCTQRYAVVKEMSHIIIDNPGTKYASADVDGIEDFLFASVNGTYATEAHAMFHVSEQLAYVVAAELLMPRCMQKEWTAIHNETDSHYKVAEFLRVPEKIVRFRFSEKYNYVYKALVDMYTNAQGE